MPDRTGDYTICVSVGNGGTIRWWRICCHSFNEKTKEHIMTWETPTAINFRYGFEITLYIANR